MLRWYVVRNELILVCTNLITEFLFRPYWFRELEGDGHIDGLDRRNIEAGLLRNLLANRLVVEAMGVVGVVLKCATYHNVLTSQKNSVLMRFKYDQNLKLYSCW